MLHDPWTRGGSSRTAQHCPTLPARRRSAQGPAFWESHHKYPGLWILTECVAFPSTGRSSCTISLECGAVVTPRPRVAGLQGQAVNPAPGDTGSISLHILPPHKCLFNSGLILDKAAGALKSPAMKTCETINPRLLGCQQHWKGFTGTMCFSIQGVLAPALGVPSSFWCSLEPRASLTSLAALCTPPVPSPLHREQFGTKNPTPSEPNASPDTLTATAPSFELLQRCPKGSVLLPRSHDITYRINNRNIFTDTFTIHSQTRMAEFCLKPMSSLSSFPHPQFSHLIICSLPGRKGQRWE